MIYVFIGDDVFAKDQKLFQLKKMILGDSVETNNFDYELLFVDDIDVDTLKKAIMTMPAIAPVRLVVLKNIHKLKKDFLEMLTTLSSEYWERFHLILDSDRALEKTALWNQFVAKAQIFYFGNTEKRNKVFDMTNAILANQAVKALKILEEILSEKGQDPLNLMGAILWAWKKAKGKMTGDVYKKGLSYIQEADLNIKRSRLVPDHAMELLLVKLCCLEAC